MLKQTVDGIANSEQLVVSLLLYRRRRDQKSKTVEHPL
jgi:hypothetical protein